MKVLFFEIGEIKGRVGCGELEVGLGGLRGVVG